MLAELGIMFAAYSCAIVKERPTSMLLHLFSSGSSVISEDDAGARSVTETAYMGRERTDVQVSDL